MPRAAITIDVDATRHYHAIHGLPPPTGTTDPPLVHGVRRFLDACARLDLRATLFVVGRDLEDPAGAFADLVRDAVRHGHEIGSHSHAHAYDLSRRAPAAIQADVLRGRDAIARVAPAPRGFRAPGYNLSEDLLDGLEKAGFVYDSSLMPSPAYFSARAAAIGLHRLRGRASSSLVGDARAFFPFLPSAPYRPRRGALHRRARSRVEGRGLVEIPITTLPFGLPWLGTTLTLSPLPVGVLSTALAFPLPRAGRAQARRRDDRPVVLELHAIDLCDADDGFDPALVRLQRDLRVPLAKKLARLDATLRILAQAGDVRTLEEIAAPLLAPGNDDVRAPRAT